MANTEVRINVPDSPAFVRAFLSGDGVQPEPAGYAITPLGRWEFAIFISEACVGIYRITLVDGDGITQRQGWVRIVADDAGPYIAEGEYSAVQDTPAGVVAAINDDATQGTLQANAATAAALPSPTATQIVAAFNADATQGTLQTNAATAAAQATEAASRSAALVLLMEADQVLVDIGGVWTLHTYQRGTTTALIPAKTGKQPGGSDLTDPITQRLAGYCE